MEPLPLTVALRFCFLGHTREDLQDCLVEVVRLVGKDVVTCSSDHLGDEQTLDRQVKYSKYFAALLLVCSFNGKKTNKRIRFLSKRTYLDFYIRSGFLQRISRLAVDVGARSINERNGNVRRDLANPLHHGPSSPAVRNGHVPEGRLTAEAQK